MPTSLSLDSAPRPQRGTLGCHGDAGPGTREAEAAGARQGSRRRAEIAARVLSGPEPRQFRLLGVGEPSSPH